MLLCEHVWEAELASQRRADVVLTLRDRRRVDIIHGVFDAWPVACGALLVLTSRDQASAPYGAERASLLDSSLGLRVGDIDVSQPWPGSERPPAPGGDGPARVT